MRMKIAATAQCLVSLALGAFGQQTQPVISGAKRLDDPDVKVRYLATITLSEIFRKGGDYAPSMYLFDKNPDFYTGRWKIWWAEQSQASPR